MRLKFLRPFVFIFALSVLFCTLALSSPPRTLAASALRHTAAHPLVLAPKDTGCSASELTATQRYWFFGTNAEVDFGVNGTTPTALAGGNMNSGEGSTVVTDTSGNLLFYSDGLQVYNRNFVVMPNGSGLTGNASAVQVVAAFPLPGSASEYVIVSNSTDSFNPSAHTLYYSIVDMLLDSGLGDVETTGKNTQLGVAGSASEALTAVPNSAGTGFWAVTYSNSSTNLLAYEFDSTGYTGTTVTTTLPTANLSGLGTLYFSPDLNLLAALTTDNLAGNSILRLLTFDRTSGLATEQFEWAGPTGFGTMAYSADFSPTADYLYVSKIFGGPSLFRYKITGNGSALLIKASEERVGTIGPHGGHVRRGPDGKMYVGNNNPSLAALHVVADPDNPVLANVGYTENGFPLAAGSSMVFGLPQTVTACGTPTTAVNVSYFHGKVNVQGNVALHWQTTTESQIAGFNVWRKIKRGQWKQLNSQLLQAKHAGDVAGATYRFLDRSVRANAAYRYKVQVTYLNNHSDWTNVIRVKTAR